MVTVFDTFQSEGDAWSSQIYDYLKTRRLKSLEQKTDFKHSQKTLRTIKMDLAEEKLNEFGYSSTNLQRIGQQNFRFSSHGKDLVVKFQHTHDLIFQYLFPQMLINPIDKRGIELNYSFSDSIAGYLKEIMNNNLNNFCVDHPIKDPLDFFRIAFPTTGSQNLNARGFIDVPLAMHEYEDQIETKLLKLVRYKVDEGKIVQPIDTPPGTVFLHACLPSKYDETTMGLLISEYHGPDIQNILHNRINDLDTLSDVFWGLGETIAFFNTNHILLGDNMVSNYVWNGKNTMRIDPIHFIEGLNSTSWKGYHLTTKEIKPQDKTPSIDMMRELITVAHMAHKEVGEQLVGQGVYYPPLNDVSRPIQIFNSPLGEMPLQKDINMITAYCLLHFVRGYVNKCTDPFAGSLGYILGTKICVELDTLYGSKILGD